MKLVEVSSRGSESDCRRNTGVVARELDVELKDPAGVGSIGWAEARKLE